MRLWSIHPKYLDTIGLLALWREGLLAKRVLEGYTWGYRNHPQLIRFKVHERPITLINAYLYQVYLEAKRRNYRFDISKIEPITIMGEITVTRGQLKFEFNHLLKKIEARDRGKFEELRKGPADQIEPNPIFRVVDGDLEPWEKMRGEKL